MENQRWNFEETEDGITVCKDEHEKGQHCEYKLLSNAELIVILEGMQARICSLDFNLKIERQ